LGNAPWLEIRSLLVAIMDFGFITGLAASMKFVRIQLAGKEKEKSLVKEKLEAELKFLRNQTNPHFLMNTLNNIYALARKKSDDTAEVVMKLSELLRFMLYESDGYFISLSDEVKVLEDYLDLEMMRYNDRLTVSCHKEIDRDSYRITPRLLLPFIENAFKHGISETRFESFIHIDIKAKEGRLDFSIENTIENTKENGHPELPKNNIGLVNVKRQLELTYREYKLDVHNGGNTFSVNLSINLESHVEI
jgi:sensor histidine kinase YesM